MSIPSVLRRSGPTHSCGMAGSSAVFFWKAIAVSKLFTIVAFAIGTFTPFNEEQFHSAFSRWPAFGEPAFSSFVSGWDAAHYLNLSVNGYLPGSTSCAFYPLWPGLLRLTGPILFGKPLLAALLLGNLCSLGAFWIFYTITKERYGESAGRDALVLMLACPGALFFSIPYTEAIYFLLVMVFFLGIEREDYLWPTVASFLMPLTRAVGVFSLVPFGWHLLVKKKRWKFAPLVFSPILGYVTYFVVIFLWTGNPFDGFDAQKAYPHAPSIANVFKLKSLYHAFINVGSLDGMLDSILDRGFFILLLVVLPAVYRLDTTWFWFIALVGLVPAMTSWFMSYRRYIIVCFPVFIVLAQLLATTGRRWIFWYYVSFMALLQAWAIKQFVTFNWAG